jgi:hypothetical protein
MRPLLPYAAGVALLFGCTTNSGLPSDQGSENLAERPSFAAEIIRDNVGGFTTAPGSPLLVIQGFGEDVTLEDLCTGSPQPLSPNTRGQAVLPPPGGFLLNGHGQDVPVLVYEIANDPCDGVGETLIAFGTVQIHVADNFLPNGRHVQNTQMRGTVELAAGGEALLVVHSTFHVLADETVKFDKTSITLTPI